MLVIFVTVLIDLIGFGMIIPLSPYLARSFGADAVTIGALMTVYSGLQFLFAPVWGRLSDKFGRRPIILLSLVGAGLSHLGFAFADSLLGLFLARGFAGLFGANISTAYAYVADVTTPENRSKSMGLIGAAFGIGFIMGPALGGFFGQLGEGLGSAPPFGPSFAAVAAGSVCLANAILAFWILPESLTLEKRRMARRREGRLAGLLRYLSVPVMGHLMVVFFLSSLAMAHIEQSLFLLMQDRFSWDFQTASYGFAYVGLVMVFTQGYLVRKLLPRLGEARCLLWGLGLAGVGYFLISVGENLSWMAVAVTSLGVGVGLSNPSVTGSISLLARESEQGESLGTHHSLSALARVLGPVTGGWLYREYGASSPFWMASLLVVMAVLLTSSVFARVPRGAK